MSPGEREQRIHAFIDHYQQTQRRTPTVGDIIRGSGVNAYDEVDQALNALIQRGHAEFVPATLGGPFTSRQVRLTAKGGRAAAKRPPAGPAAPSNPPSAPATPPASHTSSTARRPATPPAAAAPAAWTTAPSAAPLRPSAMQQPMPQPPHPLGPPHQAGIVRRTPTTPPAASPPGGAFQDQLMAWLADVLRRPPVALTLGGALAGALLYHLAQQQPVGLPAQPALTLGALTLPLALVASVVAPAALGFLAGRGIDEYGGWTRRDLVTVAVLGAAAGGLAWMWSWVAPVLAPLDRTGIPALLDGVRLLPALLPAAWVTLPGAAAIGLVAGRAVLFLGPEVSSPALAVLQLGLAALAPELWLARHGQRRDRTVLVGAGLLLGAGSVAAAYLTVPGAFVPGNWWAEAITGAIAGAAAGWAAALVHQRAASP
ncbi:hypothetical protein DCC79_10765 [bacterium]|nr:MAG: hypothetical protein DCC79_10765 [bacterium]